MRAAYAKRYGTPEVLGVIEVTAPSPGADEVLIQVHASPVTQGDRRLRAADFPGVSWLPGRLMMGPFRPKNPVPGTMFAGRIIAVGERVTRLRVGDDVFGCSMRGAHAELLVMPQHGTFARMPAGATYAEAAAVPYAAGTAVVFMRDLAKVKEGERVLIIGAAGAVGRSAVQMAKHLGAEVTGVCSARSADIARAAGADHIINYLSQDFRQNGEQYDVIMDTADVASFADVRSSLTQTGRFLTLFVSIRIVLQMLVTSLFHGKRALFGAGFGSPEQSEEVAALWKAGVFSALVDTTFPLDRIRDAHRRLESGEARGAVLVEMA